MSKTKEETVTAETVQVSAPLFTVEDLQQMKHAAEKEITAICDDFTAHTGFQIEAIDLDNAFDYRIGSERSEYLKIFLRVRL